MIKANFSYWLFLLLLYIVYGPIAIYTSRLQLTIIILIFFIILLYGLIIRKLINSTVEKWPLPKFSWIPTLLFFYIITSMLIGVYRNNFPKFILADFFPFFEFALFFFLTAMFITEYKQAKFLLITVLVAFTTKALWLLYLFSTGKLLEMQLAFSDMQSMIEIGSAVLARPIDPNISLSITCVLLYSILSSSKKEKRLLFFIILLFVFFTILSFTRSIFLGVLLSLMLMILLLYVYVDRKKALSIAGRLFITTLFFICFLNVIHIQGESIFELLINRLLHSIEQLDTKVGTLRISEIEDALNGFYSNILIGKGMGATVSSISRKGAEIVESDKSFIHNYPIGMLFKIGTIGIILFAASIILVIQKTLFILNKNNIRNVYIFFPCISFLSFSLGFFIFINFQPIVIAYHTPGLLGILFSLVLFFNDKDIGTNYG